MLENLLLFKFTFAFFIVSIVILSLGYFLGIFSTLQDFEKNNVYECGFESFLNNADLRDYDIEFLIIALSFLIFDLELIFLMPWVVHYSIIGFIGCFSIFCFLAILLIGFLIEYFRGLLHWNLAELDY